VYELRIIIRQVTASEVGIAVQYFCQRDFVQHDGVTALPVHCGNDHVSCRPLLERTDELYQVI